MPLCPAWCREPGAICDATHSPGREPTEPEYDPVRVANTSDRIAVARNDLRAAELMLEEEMFDVSLFHSQQAVERAMKALLTWYDEPVPRHHRLPDLGAACLRLVPSIAPELEASYHLSHWSMDGRYPPVKSRKAKAAFSQKLARQAVEALLSDIPPSVRGG